jgi:hypothetical protein
MRRTYFFLPDRCALAAEMAATAAGFFMYIFNSREYSVALSASLDR